jgi:NADPH2:quinone reductase
LTEFIRWRDNNLQRNVKDGRFKMTPMMKVTAIMQYGDDAFDELRIPRPVAAEGQLLIRNRATGVNNIDLMIRRGELAQAASLPFIPGVEGAGFVETVGAGVSEFEVGQRVMWFGPFTAGGYGQFVCIDARYVAPIGEEITFSANGEAIFKGLFTACLSDTVSVAYDGRTDSFTYADMVKNAIGETALYTAMVAYSSAANALFRS